MSDWIDRWARNRGAGFDCGEIAARLRERTAAEGAEIARRADDLCRRVYGNAVFLRGLLEIGNVCCNDCLYCGIRRSNGRISRYRLTGGEILERCRTGHELGFRTFVWQGGEDSFWDDDTLVGLIRSVRSEFPDSAVTLSLGERSPESYRRLFEAGADRYLLRHETACPLHYARLHPPSQSWENRMACLRALKSAGFQTGAGFMVGSPGQTERELAMDLVFLRDFRPEMAGIGPFVPQKDTPFGSCPPGSGELTVFLLGLIRLMLPESLLPATTALETLEPGARSRALRAGANVIMPNLSPASVRGKYNLYDRKACEGLEAAENVKALETELGKLGLRAVVDRGDHALWRRSSSR